MKTGQSVPGMSKTPPPTQPPPRTPPPPDTRPPSKPPKRAVLVVPDLLADAALFAEADLIRADFTLPLRPSVPSFGEGEHRLIGRVSRP